MSSANPRSRLMEAVQADDLAAIDAAIAGLDDLAETLQNPDFPWGGLPPLAGARSIAAAERLLEHGLRLEHVSRWWNPGFKVISQVVPEVGRFLVERGAEVSPHAAAGMGLLDVLQERVAQDPETVHAPGGDGATPLHFAGTVEVARFLVESGADLDARDTDHDSTPVQWLIGDAPQVARYLIDQGAAADIFVAAALGDRALCERLIDDHPACLSYWVGKPPGDDVPATYRNLGGTVLQWGLGFNSFAHQYAANLGHDDLVEFLLSRSDTPTRFLVSCVMAHRSEAERLAKENPGIVEGLSSLDKELLARYCWETNTDLEAARLMLDLGFPIDHPETRHCYMPLHNAAWGGYADLVDLLVERGAPLDVRNPQYHSTPLGHAIHCCVHDGRHPEGEYGRVVTTLIEAGCEWEPSIYPTGDDRIDQVLEPRLRQRIDGAALLGDREAFERLLATGAEPAVLDEALLCAAKGGHLDLCERLLDLGATNGPAGPYGLSPLHRAVTSGSLSVARLFLDRGAEVTVSNKYGSTPLHTAGMVGADREMIDLLMGAGGDRVLSQVSHFGATALSLAEQNGHTGTAEVFRALLESPDA